MLRRVLIVCGFRIAAWREVRREGSRGEVGVRGMRIGGVGLAAIGAGVGGSWGCVSCGLPTLPERAD